MIHEKTSSSTTAPDAPIDEWDDAPPPLPSLPPPPSRFLDNIAEVSKKTARVYALFLAVLAYCSLTVLSITDRHLVLSEPVTLPIVNVDVNLLGFILVSSLVALGVFLYLQIYLFRIKSLQDMLGTHYAKPESGTLYPWLLNLLHDPTPGEMPFLQRSAVVTSLWLSLPLFLSLFPLVYLRTHSQYLSYLVISIPLAGLWLSWWFWSCYEPKGKRVGSEIPLVGTLIWVILWNLIPLIHTGVLDFKKLQLFNLDLSYQVLSTTPMNDREHIRGLNLQGVHLEGANLQSSVLERADLRKAILTHADLRGTNLTTADLRSADLRHANMYEAILTHANLQGSRLGDADLHRANLRHADLQYVNLTSAMLPYADLTTANLTGSNLSGARLPYADLTNTTVGYAVLARSNLNRATLSHADLRHARLYHAMLWHADLSHAKLGFANLSWANLRNADLTDALLQNAILTNTDLRDATLTNADLRYADLTSVKLESIENPASSPLDRLSTVKTLYQAKLDPEIARQVMKKYPHLLAKPKDESQS